MSRRRVVRRRLRALARRYRLSTFQKKSTGQVIVVLLVLMCVYGLAVSIVEKVHG